MAELKIAAFACGAYQTNCYVVREEGASACWFVDAGEGPGVMIDFARDRGLTVSHVVLTHAHADHVAGLAEVLGVWPDAEVLIHSAERDFPGDATLNLSSLLGAAVVAPDPTATLNHGDMLTLGSHDFAVRHTPGHSPGGITLWCEAAGVAFVGDALFAGAVGRFDFPTSDGRALIAGIHREIMTLPDATRVLSGHGPETTVGAERAGNSYLREAGLGLG